MSWSLVPISIHRMTLYFRSCIVYPLIYHGLFTQTDTPTNRHSTLLCNNHFPINIHDSIIGEAFLNPSCTEAEKLRIYLKSQLINHRNQDWTRVCSNSLSVTTTSWTDWHVPPLLDSGFWAVGAWFHYHNT